MAQSPSHGRLSPKGRRALRPGHAPTLSPGDVVIMDNLPAHKGAGVRRAIEAPLRELARNAGVEGGLIVQEVKRRKGNEGYNVATGEYEDLVKAGVVDPKKVTRSALQNAASIAGLLLTTEAVITDIPEKKEKPAGDPHHGGGGMDY